jgi:cell division protein FtsQ
MIAEGWLAGQRRRAVRRRAVRLPGPRLIAAFALTLALLAGGWLWLRDSSLVGVRRVTITGVSGPDAGRIRAALRLAARNMTTLDVKNGELNTAVAPYPVVKSLSVTTQFPHGMRIRVTEEIPVGEIMVGGHTVAVASDGVLLHDAAPTSELPTISLPAAPGGSRITERDGLQLVALLTAAPYQLLPHLTNASSTAAHGLVVQLREGPSIYFGDASRLGAKWAAASAVLANSGSVGAQYIDVTDPQRPVAGVNVSSASASQSTGSDPSGTTGSDPAAGTGYAAPGTTAAVSTATPTGG